MESPALRVDAYDGLGRRTSIVGREGINKVQVYSQSGQLLYVKATNNSAATKYIYLKDRVLAEVNGPSATYHHTDLLGSPIVRTNGATGVISRARYEPYGNIATGSSGAIGFTGHVNDSDTSLIYMQQRYYDPVVGRFLSTDPMLADANTGSNFNRYRYADNGLTLKVATDAVTTSTLTKEIATAIKPANAVAVIHGHIDGVSNFVGPGDAASLRQGLPNGVVSEGRVGVTEIVGGRLQFRILEGRMEVQERRDQQRMLDAQQPHFHK